MDCNTSGSSVFHYLLEFSQIFVHWVRWWYLTISSSAAPISFWFQSFPGSQSFPMAFHMRWPKYWSISISLSNKYSGLLSFWCEWLDYLAVQEILKSLPQHQFKSISSLALSFLCSATLTSVYEYWKTIILTIWTFVGKLMSLLFNRLSSFVRAFLPRCKYLLISWLLSPSAELLELKKRKSVTASTFPPSICHEVMRPGAVIFIFWMLSFKPAFSLSFLPVSRGSLVPLHFLPLEWYHLFFWGCWYFPSNLAYSLWFTQPGISHDVLCMEVK